MALQYWAGRHADERVERARLDSVARLPDMAQPACEALEARDWEALGGSVSQNRELARALDAGAGTESMDAFSRAAEEAGSIGAQPCAARDRRDAPPG